MFDCGFRFLVMGLLLSFCEHYSIHPSQLSSGSIRTIVGVDRLKELYGLEFSVEDFNELYFLKRSVAENGYFILNLKPGRSQLVVGSKSNKGKWKNKYYFTKGFLCLKRCPKYHSSSNITPRYGSYYVLQATRTAYYFHLIASL